MKGICIFCREVVGLRKRSRLMLKHAIWVSGCWLECPGTGAYATPLPDDSAASKIVTSEIP